MEDLDDVCKNRAYFWQSHISKKGHNFRFLSDIVHASFW